MRPRTGKCPTCGQAWPRTGPKRVCVLCARPIRRHDRWHFGRRGPEHNDCAQPQGPPPAGEGADANASPGELRFLGEEPVRMPASAVMGSEMIDPEQRNRRAGTAGKIAPRPGSE